MSRKAFKFTTNSISTLKNTLLTNLFDGANATTAAMKAEIKKARNIFDK